MAKNQHQGGIAMSRNSRFRSSLIQLSIMLLLLNAPLPLRAQSQAQQPNQPQKAAPKPGEQPVQNPAQAPPEQSQDPSQDPDNVVRINTQLVQIDAVVTDGKGNHVENLTEDDFELAVDGKKQALTYFRLVKLPEPKRAETSAGKDAPKSAKDALPPTTMPAKSLAPEDVKRTIAFVVDDLGLSFQSTYFAREAIKKFVREQMQEGDLVGIIRTGRGAGALQQFTSDKRILYAAIEKLNWNPNSRDMLPNFGGNDPNDQRSQEARDAEARAEDFRETVFSVGTLGALNFVVSGLRELPGRKMAILISDGFRLFGRERNNSQVLDNLRRLVDRANRSSVVVYSIDAKGLQTLMPDASTSGVPRPEDFSRVSQENFDSQEGLTYIARETGGLAFLNNNDINLGIRRSLDDGRSYYLLGFDPENEKFDRKYHSIKLKVTRPGLRVRTRAGFIGVPDRERRQEQQQQLAGPEARNRQIVGALYSPFGARDLSLQMTSYFFNSEKEGSFVRSLYHIDPDRLTLKDDPQRPGVKTLALEIVSFSFNEAGVILDQHGRSFTLSFEAEALKRLMAKGLVYTNDFVLKKPGAYQFRTVLRDPATGKLGSAGQFIQVPDLTKKRLALSGLVLAAYSPEPKDAKAPTAESPEVNSSSAVRRFPQGGALEYGAAIYNAKTDSQSGKPNLTAQVEIYQDGKQLYQSPPRQVDMPGVGGRVDVGGRLSLGNLPPGDYQLHLTVTDVLAKSKYARADQWMDFGIR
jgi:VWFA-related protein